MPVLRELEKSLGAGPAANLGLKDDDIIDAAFSLTGIQASIDGKPADARVAFAVSTARPFTIARIRQILRAASRGQSERGLGEESIAPDTFLVFKAEAGQPDLYLTSVKCGEGSLIVGGTRQSALDAIERYRYDNIERPSGILNALKSALPGRQGWLVVSLPDSVREQVDEQLEGGGAAMLNMFAPGLADSLGSLEGCLFAVAVDEAMDFQIGFTFSGGGAASAFAEAINASPFLQQMKQQPQAPEAFRNFELEADGSLASFTLSLDQKQAEEFIASSVTAMPVSF
jgi:hypothetical protein